MPNRIIKESICTSEDYAALTLFQRDVFIRLCVTADDYGRFDGRGSVLKGRMFPLEADITAKSIDEAIAVLCERGMVDMYEADGRPFIHLTSWEKHQQTRAQKSKYPPPPSDSSASNGNQRKSSDSNGNQMHPYSESNTNTKTKTKSVKEIEALPPLERAIEDFKAFRKSIRRPMTDHAVDLLRQKLIKLSSGDVEMQIAIINQSIVQGWQGVFELKDDFPARTRQKGGAIDGTCERDYESVPDGYGSL